MKSIHYSLKSLVLPATSPELTQLIFRGEFDILVNGKQEFRRTDFGSRLLAGEDEGGEDRCV
jgi:hypothetical protein